MLLRNSLRNRAIAHRDWLDGWGECECAGVMSGETPQQKRGEKGREKCRRFQRLLNCIYVDGRIKFHFILYRRIFIDDLRYGI